MPDFSVITERLLCGGQFSSGDIGALRAAGVTHIISARAEYDDPLPLLNGFFYLRWGVNDDGLHPKPVEWFDKSVSFALAALSSPKTKVLAHCAAGFNRGPSIAYAIMRAQGWRRDEALAQLHLRRPICVGGIAYRDDADSALRALGFVS